MDSPTGPDSGHAEQLIGALIPPATRRAPPAAPLVTVLPPTMGLPAGADADSLLLDMARLYASGRFSARRLLRALDWPPPSSRTSWWCTRISRWPSCLAEHYAGQAGE